jgi:DNA-binding transcriptional regulator YiaG
MATSNVVVMKLDRDAMKAIEKLTKALERSNQLEMDKQREQTRVRPPTPIHMPTSEIEGMSYGHQPSNRGGDSHPSE